MPRRRLALLVATYRYEDAGLRQLMAPMHDAEALAEVLRHPEIADFDVTILVNEPHHVVGRAIGEFYRNRRRDDLTLLYFTGHGLKDDEGRLYLAMTNTTRDDLLFTALSAQQIDYAMDSCLSRQNVLILDCCYSGAFPVGRIFKADGEVGTLEKFQGKGRVVLTASDATQYSFEGNSIIGQGTRSVFTRFLVEGLTTGLADLDGDGDISLDELYSYVHDRVTEEMPQQRPKKQENVEGRVVIARNINWRLPTYILNAIDSPFVPDRLAVVTGLAHLHRVGNDLVKAEVIKQTRRLIHDDSKAVSTAAMEFMTALNPEVAPRDAEQVAPRDAEQVAPRDAEQVAPRDAEEPRWVPAVSGSPQRWAGEQDERQVVPSPTPSLPAADTTARSRQPELEAWSDQYSQAGATTEKQTPQQARREVEEQARRKVDKSTAPLVVVVVTVCVIGAIVLLVALDRSVATSPPGAGPETTMMTAPSSEAVAPIGSGVTKISDIFGPACSQVPTEGPGSAQGMVNDPVATAASHNPLLTTLTKAVTASNLVDTLNSAPAVTVFAPADPAFEALEAQHPGILKELTTAPDVATPNSKLAKILTYHVVGTRYDAAGLAQAGTLDSLEGAKLKIGGTAAAPTVNGAPVLCGNIPTKNATVFVIGQVLSPPA